MHRPLFASLDTPPVEQMSRRRLRRREGSNAGHAGEKGSADFVVEMGAAAAPLRRERRRLRQREGSADFVVERGAAAAPLRRER